MVLLDNILEKRTKGKRWVQTLEKKNNTDLKKSPEDKGA